MSKLSLLAKKRAANRSESSNKSVDILDRLTGGSEIRKSTSGDSVTHQATNTDSGRQQQIPTQNSPQIAKKESRTPSGTVTSSKRSFPRPHVSVSPKPINSKSSEDMDLAVTLKVTFDSSLITSPKLYINPVHRHQKRQKLFTNYEIPVEISKKIDENFSKPSPDDKVLNANKKAFDDFKNLDINDKKAGAKPKGKQVDIRKHLETLKTKLKPNKWFVVIGHVDSGKSTLVGRLLLDTKAVDLNTVEKLRKESEKIGKGSFALAWLTDSTSEERSRGVTKDIALAEFETEKARLTAIDAPGHKDFVPQLINGVCQADTALVIIDSTAGEFEAGFQNDGQTKEHIVIAKSFGIKRIGVVINKMDKEDWSVERFTFIKNELTDYLVNEVGFELADITWIPASGLTGENVTKANGFKADGVTASSTVLDFIESGSNIDIDSICEQRFNFQINEINDINNNEFSVVGRVLSGAIGAGQTVKISPMEEDFTINKIRFKSNPSDVAYVGELFELFFNKKQLKDKNFSDINADYAVTNDPAVQPSNSFVCDLNLFTISKPLLVGSPVVVFRNNSKISCKLAGILQTSTGKTKKHLISHSQARVKFTIENGINLPMSTYEQNAKFGKVVLRRFGATIGAGTIVEVPK